MTQRIDDETPEQHQARRSPMPYQHYNLLPQCIILGFVRPMVIWQSSPCEHYNLTHVRHLDNGQNEILGHHTNEHLVGYFQVYHTDSVQ
jgi:hypothetical protein